ncbi:tetratricopeptide repeat protein [Amorphus sp. MBR-141]
MNLLSFASRDPLPAMVLRSKRALAVALFAVAVSGAGARAEVADKIANYGLSTLSGSYLAARHAGNLKDLASAAAFYKRALAADPDNELLLDRTVMLLVASGALPEAVEFADDLAASDPTNQLAALTLSVDALSNGDPTAARTALAPLSTGSPLPELTAALLAAWSYAAEENWDKALSTLDALEGPDWFQTFTTLHSGLIADMAGEHEEAVERLKLSFDNDPRALRVLDAYARALARAGRTEEAETIVDGYIAAGGDHPLVQALKTELAAGDVAPQIDDASSGASEALYGLGVAVGQEGGQEYAAGYLQLAIHLGPDTDLPAFSLASLYESMQQYDNAVAIYRTIPADSPLADAAAIQIGLNLNADDDFEAAKAQLEPIVDADPSDLSAVVALGNVLRSQEDFEGSRKVYSQGIATIEDPVRDHWTLYYFRGISNERTDHWDEAEADFKQALELYPDQPLVLNYLGYSWVDKHMNIDEAVEMIQKAVSQRPDDGYIVDSLGWAYYRLGRYDEAVQELERAVELRSSDPVINDHLGDAYWQVGRKLEAMFQWNHALELEPTEKDRLAIELKLKDGLSEPKTDAAAATPAATAE